MSWLAEFLVQGVWEGIVEVAYRKWGFFGAMFAVLLPIATLILILVVAASS